MRAAALLSVVLIACVADPIAPVTDLAVVDLAAAEQSDQARPDLAVPANDLADLAEPADLTMTIPDLVGIDGGTGGAWIADNLGLGGGELVDLACASSTACLAITPRLLFVTNDGGATWTRAANQPPLAPLAKLLAVAVHPTDLASHYVATATQVYKRTANGSFTELTSSTDLGVPLPGPIKRLVIANGSLYAVDPVGVFRWNTATSDWQSVTYDLPLGTTVDAFGQNAFVFLARSTGLWYRQEIDSSWTQFIATPIASIGVSIESSLPQQAFLDTTQQIWSNASGSFEKCNALTASAIGVAPWGELIATTATGYAKVASNCKTIDWVPFDPNPNSSLSRYVAVGDTRLYGLGAHGLFELEAPAAIQRADVGIDAVTVAQFAAPKTSAGFVWAATPQGLYKRDPANGRWTEQLTSYGAYRSLGLVSVSPVDSQHVLIAQSPGTDGAASAGSKNGGSGWAASSASGYFSSIVHSPVDAARAIGCHGDTLELTSNDGADWAPIDADLGGPGKACHHVARHPTQNVLFAASTDRVWRSSDGGTSWQPLGGTGLDGKTIRALAANPQNSNEAYVVLVDDGLWRVDTATATMIYDPIPQLWQLATVGDKIYVVDDTRVLRRTGGGAFAVLQTGALTYAPSTIFIHPADENELYVGSVGNGVRRSYGDWN